MFVSNGYIFALLLIFLNPLVILLIVIGIVFFFFRRKHQAQKHASAYLDFLISEIKIHIKNTYPNISIDYAKIENTKSKNKLLSDDILIVEDIVLQFATQNIDIQPKYIPKDELWSSYEELSTPIHGKIPKDFIKRKELAFIKNNGECTRCGKKLKITDTRIHLLKSLEKKGTYHFENIFIVCNDCNRILNAKKNVLKIIPTLEIYDYLLSKTNH